MCKSVVLFRRDPVLLKLLIQFSYKEPKNWAQLTIHFKEQTVFLDRNAEYFKGPGRTRKQYVLYFFGEFWSFLREIKILERYLCSMALYYAK